MYLIQLSNFIIAAIGISVFKNHISIQDCLKQDNCKVPQLKLVNCTVYVTVEPRLLHTLTTIVIR